MALAPERPVPPISRFVRSGDHIYVSGQVPLDPNGALVPNEITAQTMQVLDNLEAVLAEAGATLDDVVKTTVFLTNVKRDFEGMNAVYSERFARRKPSRSTIGAELAIDALIEIEAVAVVQGE